MDLTIPSFPMSFKGEKHRFKKEAEEKYPKPFNTLIATESEDGKK